MKRVFKFKYQVVADVLLSAHLGQTPDELAAQVRRRHAKGVYAAVRICEDLGHLIRGDGRFIRQNVALSPAGHKHAIALRERMKADGTWRTRRTTVARRHTRTTT